MQFAEINFNCYLPLLLLLLLPLLLLLLLQLPHWFIIGASDVPQLTHACCIRSAACVYRVSLAFDWLATQRLDSRLRAERAEHNCEWQLQCDCESKETRASSSTILLILTVFLYP